MDCYVTNWSSCQERKENHVRKFKRYMEGDRDAKTSSAPDSARQCFLHRTIFAIIKRMESWERRSFQTFQIEEGEKGVMGSWRCSREGAAEKAQPRAIL